MIRELVRHTGILLVANLASRAASFLLIPLYTRYLPPDQMGGLSLMLTFSSLVGITLTLGVPSAVYMCYLNETDAVRKDKYLGHALWATLGLSTVAALVMLSLTSPALAYLNQGITFGQYLLLVGSTWASNVSTLILVFYRVKGRTLTFALWSMAQLTANLTITVFLVVSAGLGVTGILIGMLVSACLPLPVLALMRRELALPWEREIFRSYLRLGTPIALGNILFWSTGSANRFFLEAFGTVSDVGLFDVAARIGQLTLVIAVMPFFQAWNYLMFWVKDQPGAPGLYAEIFCLFIVGNFGVTTLAIALVGPLGLLIGPGYREALPVVPTLLVAGAVTGIHYFMVFGTAINSVVIEHKTTFAAAVVGVVANLFLIPRHGVAGAAFAVLASGFTLAAITSAYSRANYTFPIRWKIVVPAVSGCLVVWALSPSLHGAAVGYSLGLAALAALLYGGLGVLLLRSRARLAASGEPDRRLGERHAAEARQPRLRIVQIGSYPPPYGGVAVHLQRLLEYLRARGADAWVYDIWGGAAEAVPGVVRLPWRSAVLRLLFANRCVVHLHLSDPSAGSLLLSLLLALRHPLVYSFHNELFLENLRRRSVGYGFLMRLVLKRMTCVVVDNESCRRLAAEIVSEPAQLRVLPEFLPPFMVPALIAETALRARQAHRYLLASNAFTIVIRTGIDQYGIDLLVELVDRLRGRHHLDVGLVFLLPSVGNEAYLRTLRERIGALDLDEHFVILTEPLAEASSLWCVSDLVVRATNTDGNSLTVLEALAAGTPVVASDCVERPPGTVLFRTRDLEDLVEQVRLVLADIEGQRSRVGAHPVCGSGPAFADLYRSLGA